MTACFAPPPLGFRADLARFPNPLDLLSAEHAQLRAACASLDAMAKAERADPRGAQALAATLRAVVPAHTADEDGSFFPLLQRRAAPEDDIVLILGHLADDHVDAANRLKGLLSLLDRLGEGTGELTGGDRADLAGYADTKLRHLSLETAILMPIARERLSAEDLDALRDAIAARRRGDSLAVPA
jgi:hemerythrin-like domain-containing protein